MTRWLPVLGLAATTLGCGVAHAPEDATSREPSRLVSAESCPAVAMACSGGCFALQAHPVDRAHRCLLPRQTFGCSPFDTIGPPGVACSVAPDETIWISFDARQYPRGRPCSGPEQEAVEYLRCP